MRSSASGAWARGGRSGTLATWLVRSAYMLGRDDDYVSSLERAHDAYRLAGEPLPAVRCAIWFGHNMLFRGEVACAGGWFARARRHLEADGSDC